MKLLVPFMGFMLAVAAMMPLSSSAQAGKSVACKAKSLEGKATKWSCKSGEKCCYSLLLNQGTCGKGPMCL